MLRMEKIAHLGIAARSHYTGKCTMETVFVFLNKLWQTHGLIPADTVNIKTYHGSDLEPCCIEVMLAHKEQNDGSRPSVKHVFGDMRDRLDDETKKALDDIRPSKLWPAEQKRACYKLLEEILDTNARKIFHPQATSWCYRHQKRCKVFDMDDSDDDVALPTHVELEEDDSQVGLESQESCVMVCMRTVVDNRLKFISGGHSCTDFAGYGDREGDSGLTRECFLLFTAEIKATTPDCGLTEITPTCPKDYLKDALGDDFDLVTIVFGPEDLGFPCRRQRRFFFFWRKATVVWYGSVDEFMEIFKSRPVLDADAYLRGPAGQRQDFARARAAKHGNIYPDDVVHIPMNEQLSCEGVDRSQTHLDKQLELCGLNGCYVYDVMQSAQYCRGGWLMPPLVTHGLIASSVKNDFMMPIEHLLVQGEPALPDLCGDFKNCFPELIDKWSKSLVAGRPMIFMAGNAMHVGVLGAWAMYCLSNIEVAMCSDAVALLPLSLSSSSLSLWLRLLLLWCLLLLLLISLWFVLLW